MLHFRILFSLLLTSIVSRLSAETVCEMSSIRSSSPSVRYHINAVRVEQECHRELLNDLAKKLDTCLSKTGPETMPYGKSCAKPTILAQSSEIMSIVVPTYSDHPFMVACDQLSHGGGWTIFLRRTDGSEDFNRDWNDYKHGFGKLQNEFFLGLDKLHAMTSAEAQELLVLLEDHGESGDTRCTTTFESDQRKRHLPWNRWALPLGMLAMLSPYIWAKSSPHGIAIMIDMGTTVQSLTPVLGGTIRVMTAIWLEIMATTPMERASSGLRLRVTTTR
ncbi:techylectin-5B-like isoform X1 [Drosophila miranda]|uniref:techylectin-5B-like isoform X1 n=1 Tax=Drosophila miranda TaxID=7229 RepID=UPI00143FB3BD|nr:techylectin-5B-like isoform X1 [Drosophila miranda]